VRKERIKNKSGYVTVKSPGSCGVGHEEEKEL